MDYRNFSGVRPEARHWDEQFTITTDMVCGYLQKKLDTVVSEHNRQNSVKVPDVGIHIDTVKYGGVVRPFMAIFPMEILKQSYYNPNELSMFNARDSVSSGSVIDLFWDFINAYRYTEEDVKLYKDKEYVKDMEMSPKDAERFIEVMPPHIVNMGNMEHVLVAFDPVRVFHDMLTPVNDPEAVFEDWIDSCVQIRDGNYKYKVKMVFENGGGGKKGKKKNKKNKQKHKHLYNAVVAYARGH